MVANADEPWVELCRAEFPALRDSDDAPPILLDGPAGTQVPRRVVDAMSAYLFECNANRGGKFPSARTSDERLDAAHAAVADFLGTNDPDSVVFGANMTSLTFALSRTLARTWRPGDEIVVTRSEHDANYSPWILAARDAGVTVRQVGIRLEDCTLDLEDFRNQLSEKTRLVAVGCASNASGTRHPVRQICKWAREVGAWTFLDAVHFAPHDLIDVTAWGCDFLACSAYKFFGPHVGILWGRREHLEHLEPYKLRPAPHVLPGKWMTGTQSHEAICGTHAAIDYLADLGRRLQASPSLNRRAALQAAFSAIVPHERHLVTQLLRGLQAIPGIRVWGITDPARFAERLPTVAWTHPNRTSAEIAELLGKQGIAAWHGNYYALPLTEQLGVEPQGMVRMGMVHYNTSDEITRTIHATKSLFC